MQCLLNKVSDNTVCMWKQSLDLQCGMCLVMRPVDCWNKNLHHEQEFLGFGPKTKVVMYTYNNTGAQTKDLPLFMNRLPPLIFPCASFISFHFFFFMRKFFMLTTTLRCDASTRTKPKSNTTSHPSHIQHSIFNSYDGCQRLR
jgi:hypothetical protein